jgi:hypothetical protein
MRWTHPTPPKKGDTRTVTAFLWWPMRIGSQSRWLEKATWMETAQRCSSWTPGELRYPIDYPDTWAWVPACWGSPA